MWTASVCSLLIDDSRIETNWQCNSLDFARRAAIRSDLNLLQLKIFTFSGSSCMMPPHRDVLFIFTLGKLVTFSLKQPLRHVIRGTLSSVCSRCRHPPELSRVRKNSLTRSEKSKQGNLARSMAVRNKPSSLFAGFLLSCIASHISVCECAFSCDSSVDLTPLNRKSMKKISPFSSQTSSSPLANQSLNVFLAFSSKWSAS